MPPVLADFHFLRPWWLLALLPCALLVLWFARRRRRPALWSTLIDPALLGHLLLPAQANHRGALPLALLAGWTLAVLGLAGPAWERLPEPLHRSGEALIVALELDASMRATDLAPSRLERARHKIADVLALRRDGLTALIVYAGDAHVVTPLSDDANTLAAMLPALDPAIMPEPGNDPVSAAELAAQLLRGAGLDEGRVLFIADALPRHHHAALVDTLGAAGLEFSLLAAGTEPGSPIPLADGGFLRDADGAILVAGMDSDTMREATAAAGGRFALLGVDDRDLRHLLPQGRATRTLDSRDQHRRFDRWQDRAPWLALALLPLAALAFRRGWLLGATLLVLLPTPRAEALEWRDLWLTRDQQAARALADGDAARAASLFRSQAWRGAAQYRAGDHDGAAASWSGLDDANAHYNRGNALARAGRLDEALAAYDAALALDPQHTDAVANRRLVEELARQREAQSRAADDGDDASRSAGKDGEMPPPGADGSESDQTDRTDGSARERDTPDQPPASGEDGAAARDGDGERAHDDADSSDGVAMDDRAAPSPADGAGEPPYEEEQAMEHWLRRIPDDPGALLRRKFEYEHRLRRGEREEEAW